MFDYVVVGGGSAGCVLANRLSADPKRKVVLAHVDGRRMFWPRGKVLGGTSCLNAMVYIRGHRDNYDEWRELGNPGWGWSDVLPYFKRSEDHHGGASELHGEGGPLPVTQLATTSPVTRAFVEATAARCKVAVTTDFNGPDQEGAGFYDHTLRDGLRASTAVRFLDPVRDRPNLTVISDALATGLVVDGDRVRGVRVRVRGAEQTIHGSEVIVCGGAVGSPHLLLLSGIGPAGELREVGVTSTHDLPGVGKHLEDHLLVPMMFEVERAGGAGLTRLGLIGGLFDHLARRRGKLAVSPLQAGAFVRTRPDAPRPDNQFHMMPVGYSPPNTDAHRPVPFGPFVSIMPGLIYPRSHGELRLRSADPAAAPVLDPRYLSDGADLEHLLAGVKLTREIAATEPLARFLGAEVQPGPRATSDDDLRAHIRAAVNTIFHPVGTCRMGADKLAVVDAELRVHGLRGLRVVDASVMPKIIGGNTNAPTIMIAEKAADLIAQA